MSKSVTWPRSHEASYLQAYSRYIAGLAALPDPGVIVLAENMYPSEEFNPVTCAFAMDTSGPHPKYSPSIRAISRELSRDPDVDPELLNRVLSDGTRLANLGIWMLNVVWTLNTESARLQLHQMYLQAVPEEGQ